MERTMRRKDRELSQAECWELLKQGTHGVLSVVGDEGWPYAVPINYIEHQGNLYLHCAKAGYKLDAIARDERVCFTVVLKGDVIPGQVTTDYESLVLLGRAQVVEDEEERLTALNRFIEILSPVTPDLQARYVEQKGPHALVLRITPVQLTGKASRNIKPIEERLK